MTDSAWHRRCMSRGLKEILVLSLEGPKLPSGDMWKCFFLSQNHDFVPFVLEVLNDSRSVGFCALSLTEQASELHPESLQLLSGLFDIIFCVSYRKQDCMHFWQAVGLASTFFAVVDGQKTFVTVVFIVEFSSATEFTPSITAIHRHFILGANVSRSRKNDTPLIKAEIITKERGAMHSSPDFQEDLQRWFELNEEEKQECLLRDDHVLYSVLHTFSAVWLIPHSPVRFSHVRVWVRQRRHHVVSRQRREHSRAWRLCSCGCATS